MKKTLWLIAFASFILAADKIAIAVKASGDVSFLTSGTKGEERKLQAGTVLFDEDIVRTGENGYMVALYLDDKTTIKIRPESEFLIGGVRSGKGIDKRVKLSYGAMRAKIAKQKNSEFLLATSVSVASVKGTDLVVESDPLLGDNFVLIEGLIEVTNNATGESTMVEEGETVNSTNDGTLTVTETVEEEIPEFDDDTEGENEEQGQPQEIRIELRDPSGNTKELLIKYQ